MRGRDLAGWLSLAVGILVLDRATKVFVIHNLSIGERIPVLPFFSWVHLENVGAAFNFLSNAGGWQRWLFVAIAIGFSVYLIYEMLRIQPGQKLYGWAYGMILGGAWGNLYDRLIDGRVVDFVLVHYEEHYFPAFNLADSAISVGAAAWILLMIRDARRHRAAVQSDSG